MASTLRHWQLEISVRMSPLRLSSSGTGMSGWRSLQPQSQVCRDVCLQCGHLGAEQQQLFSDRACRSLQHVDDSTPQFNVGVPQQQGFPSATTKDCTTIAMATITQVTVLVVAE